jgi:hypothetical protein
VCTQLLEEATLIVQLPIENRYICHQVAEVHAGAKIFIDTLLMGSEKLFEAYQVHSLPFFDSDINYFVSVSTAALLLVVSMNRQLFTILTDDVLYKYKNVYFTVCPAAIVIYVKATTLFSSFISWNGDIARKVGRTLISNPNLAQYGFDYQKACLWSILLVSP